MLRELVISMRPQQWYKNGLVFVGIIFAQKITEINLWIYPVAAFIVFCLLSGSLYIINDLLDIEKDRIDPQKRGRPIASGRLNRPYALTWAIFLLLVALGGAYFINFPFFISALAYLVLTLSYSLLLKRYSVIDLLAIAGGFVIRPIAGCLAIGAIISPWLIICSFLLALFLGLAKRRHELVTLGDDAKNHREAAREYSSRMLDLLLSSVTGALITAYSVYTFLAHHYFMMFTIPFVVYGLFRYLGLIYSQKYDGKAEIVFKDKGILLCMTLWLIFVVVILLLSPVELEVEGV
jgi:4-hydroxybenzoate polyprenyltransferase